LTLVTPDLHGRHTGIINEDVTDLKDGAETRVVNELRKSVGKTSSTDIVDRLDRVLGAVDTSVNDLLTTTFHLGVLSLNRGKIEVGSTSSTCHGTGSSTSETDQHTGTTEDNDLGTGSDLVLSGILRSDVTETTSNHDGFVVSPPLVAVLGCDVEQEGSEVTTESRSSEFVVERSGTEGSF
jgi:hypothetical protein